MLARLAAAGRVGYGRADIYGGWDRGPPDRGDYGITLYIGDAAKQATRLDRGLDGKTSAEIAAATPPLAPGRGAGPGMVRGRPHSEWHAEVQRLERIGDEAAAEALLLEICDATEAEARAEGYGVAPAAYERLAVHLPAGARTGRPRSRSSNATRPCPTRRARCPASSPSGSQDCGTDRSRVTSSRSAGGSYAFTHTPPRRT